MGASFGVAGNVAVGGFATGDTGAGFPTGEMAAGFAAGETAVGFATGAAAVGSLFAGNVVAGALGILSVIFSF